MVIKPTALAAQHLAHLYRAIGIGNLQDVDAWLQVIYPGALDVVDLGLDDVAGSSGLYIADARGLIAAKAGEALGCGHATTLGDVERCTGAGVAVRHHALYQTGGIG